MVSIVNWHVIPIASEFLLHWIMMILLLLYAMVSVNHLLSWTFKWISAYDMASSSRMIVIHLLMLLRRWPCSRWLSIRTTSSSSSSSSASWSLMNLMSLPCLLTLCCIGSRILHIINMLMMRTLISISGLISSSWLILIIGISLPRSIEIRICNWLIILSIIRIYILKVMNIVNDIRSIAIWGIHLLVELLVIFILIFIVFKFIIVCFLIMCIIVFATSITTAIIIDFISTILMLSLRVSIMLLIWLLSTASNILLICLLWSLRYWHSVIHMIISHVVIISCIIILSLLILIIIMSLCLMNLLVLSCHILLVIVRIWRILFIIFINLIIIWRVSLSLRDNVRRTYIIIPCNIHVIIPSILLFKLHRIRMRPYWHIVFIIFLRQGRPTWSIMLILCHYGYSSSSIL